MLAACLQESLGSSTVARRFATELVAAVNRVNYNQDSGLNAFAGECMLPVAAFTSAFATQPGLVWSKLHLWITVASSGFSVMEHCKVLLQQQSQLLHSVAESCLGLLQKLSHP